MIVPQFWDEARIQQKVGDRQITARRFGWPEISQVDAQGHAEERVKEAFEQLARGEKLSRREKKSDTTGQTEFRFAKKLSIGSAILL
jgi:hypothetical protein